MDHCNTFRMDLEKLLINELKENEELLYVFPPQNSKDEKKARELRVEGNKLYELKYHNFTEHVTIWEYYSGSIATAEIGSEEQALAYENRSELLFHLVKYDDCVKDIDRALAITSSNDLKLKVICRKIKCLMNNDETNTSTLEECLNKINDLIKLDNVQMTDEQSLLIQEAQTYFADLSKNVEVDNLEESTDPLMDYEVNEFNSIYIEHNEKYGNHLVAQRDIKPGEIIFAEKPYVTVINTDSYHAFCSHCFVTCWSTIPCDTCDWSMFCSEKCKNDAWHQYHDVECMFNPFEVDDPEMTLYVQTSIRSFITGFREAGSIQKLRESIDQNISLKHVTKDGKFNTNKFRYLCSLHMNKNRHFIRRTPRHAITILFRLATYTNLFGKDLNSQCVQLTLSDDALFIGVLIMKLLIISKTNAFKHNSIAYAENYLEKGWSIGIMTSLINHSCYPNSVFLMSKDNNILLCALQPIKKDTQIFINYGMLFYNYPLSERQLLVQNGFGFECDCVSCKENWPVLNEDRTVTPNLCHVMMYERRKFKKPLEKRIYEKNKEIIHLIYEDAGTTKYNVKMLKTLAHSIEKATKELEQPCFLTCLLTEALCTVFFRLHGDTVYIPNCLNLSINDQL